MKRTNASQPKSGPKRQKHTYQIVNVFSEHKIDHPIYEFIDTLFAFGLSLKDVDTLLAVCHSMRSAVFKSNIVLTFARRLDNAKEAPKLEEIHQIYELWQSGLIRDYDYYGLMKYVVVLLKDTEKLKCINYMYGLDTSDISKLYVTPWTTESVMLIACKVFANIELDGFDKVRCMWMHVSDFNMFNWNDRKRIFKALVKTGISISNTIANLVLYGIDIDAANRLLTIHDKNCASHNNMNWEHNPSVILTEKYFDALWNYPKLATFMLKHTFLNDITTFSTLITKAPLGFLDQINLGKYVCKHLQVLRTLHHAGMLYGTLVVLSKMQYFKGVECVKLLTHLYPISRISINALFEHTGIANFLENVPFGSGLTDLLESIRNHNDDRFDLYFRTAFKLQSIEIRAAIVVRLFVEIPAPSHVYFMGDEQFTHKQCLENHELTFYLYQCLLLKNKQN